MTPGTGQTRLSRVPTVLFLLAGIAIALLVGLGGMFRLGPVLALDRLLLDGLMARTASGAPPSGTVVVDIDDASLSALGQWPWPRYRVAQLIDRIAAAHPSAIAMDILFPEPDRTSLADIRRTFKRDFGVDISFSGVPPGLLDNDGWLAHEMARADVIGARYFEFDRVTHADRPVRPGLGFDGRIDLLEPDRASGVLDSIDPIASQTRTSGFVNSRLDGDGVLRRLPVMIEYEGVLYPSLALAATMHALGVRSARVDSGPAGLSLRIGKRAIPLDRSAYALLRFNGPAQVYPGFSAVDVLAGHVRAADLRGRIVFIGSSAVGLHDVHRTAVDPDFSGLKIQSVMAQEILDGASARIPPWGGQAALALGVLLALLVSGLFVAGRGLALLGACCVATAGGLLAAAYAVFVRTGVFLPIGAPLLVLAVLVVACFAARFALDQRRAQRWRRQLENARQVAIESMAAVAETRDPETGGHIKRTQHYVRAVARQLQRTGKHLHILDKEYIHLLFLSAPLHDIGKVGVPDHILLKPGPLTADETTIMRRHAEFGRQIIQSTARHIEGDNFLVIAGEIAATHHEKWDGTGYPEGLRGEEIPLSGRIMAIADIYDALISRRCYKEPFPHARARLIIQGLRGTTFDPAVLDAFLAIEPEIRQIADRFRDGEDAAANNPVAPRSPPRRITTVPLDAG